MEQTDLVTRQFDASTGIATLTFNRPKVFNALDIATAEAFEQAVHWLTTLPGLRCVVLTGAGKAFVAGGDVAAFAADPDRADRTLSLILKHMHPAILTLRGLDAPVMTALNGTAAGAGFALVLASDHVVASRTAKLVLAYDKLGTSPDCGSSWFMTRRLGRQRAFELMLTGRSLSADDAQDWGIVNQVAEVEDFAVAVQTRAAQIAAGPTRAFGLFKRLMDAQHPLAAQLEMERESFMLATGTEDFRAATRGFVDKTPVTFKGC